MPDLLKEEYRVLVRHRLGTKTVVTVRQEGPWDNKADAARFAAQFTQPKFEEAWVEGRLVSHWGRVA